MRYLVKDGESMRELGRAIAPTLVAGDLVILSGGLGAGKTTLVQGIGAGMMVRGQVASPTFIISRAHEPAVEGPWLVHVDAYRLGSLAELDHLDLDDSTDEAVTVVEWGHGLVEGLADDRIEVVLDVDPSTEVRVATISGLGGRWSVDPSALATLGGRAC